MMSQAVSELSR